MFNRNPQLNTNQPLADVWILLGILICCLSLRCGVIAFRFQELQDDPDAYIGISRNIAAGRGFTVSETDRPTAFRPPLYPLLIAPFSSENGAGGRALLNLLAAAGSMVLIWRTAGHLSLSRTGKIVSVLAYGCDPLLLRYSSLSMMETVCSFLSAWLLWRLTRLQPVETGSLHQRSTPDREWDSRSTSVTSRIHRDSQWVTGLLTGIIFGLCALARPTYWVFGILYVTYCMMHRFLRNRRLEDRPHSLVSDVSVGLGVVLVVSPWVMRNFWVFGSFILMTTHGGYTLLLGNNPAFYAEVVEQPLGTVWDGTHGPGQAVWAETINQEMDALGLHTELERDRWMGNLAKQTILQNPVLFLQSCRLRFIRFWNIVPSGPAAENLPPQVLLGVGAYYTLFWLCALAGSIQVLRSRFVLERNWGAVFLLVFAFTLLHLFYWSNVRMRAPIVPALALLSGACFLSRPIDKTACIDSMPLRNIATKTA